MPALAELERRGSPRARDPSYAEELAVLSRDFCGRPTPLYLAERLSEAAGREIWLKREDLMHTGSHKLNNALGQALLARRMGKPRIIAETGAGQHGVASATVVRAARPRVRRLHGRRGHPPPAAQRPADGAARGARRDRRGGRADAEGGGLRGDPRLGHERRRHALHHRLGRRPGAVPGDRARPAARDRRRGARAAARARRAGCPTARSRASAAARTRSGCSPASSTTRASSSSASRRRARASRPAATARRSPSAAARACCTARSRRSCRTTTARSARRTRSRPGLDYPGSGPEHAWLRDSGRARYVAVTDDDALADVPPRDAARGDHPGARDRARAALRAASRPRAGSTSSAARGGATRTSPRCSRGRDCASLLDRRRWRLPAERSR